MEDHAFPCSIVIPLFNRADLTAQCLTRLVDTTPPGLYEVVLVDNGSTDGTGDLLDALDGDVTIVRNLTNLGFARACNQGAGAARGRHLVFLNNDTEPFPGWLEPLLHTLDSEPDVGAVGSKLLFPDGTVQHAGVVLVQDERASMVPFYGHHVHHGAPADHPGVLARRDVQVVTGASLAVRREAFFAAGGFDEAYWNGNEDVDLCLKLRTAGLRVVYEPGSVLVHHESASGPERFSKVQANNELLARRWQRRVVPDLLMTAAGGTRPHPSGGPLSVVVAATRPDALAVTLPAVLAAVRAGDEVVVVDDTPDGAVTAAAGLVRLRDPRVRPVTLARPAPVDDALAAGVAAATGTYVALLRQDVVVSPGCLDELLCLHTSSTPVAAAPLLDQAGPQAWTAHTPASRATFAPAAAELVAGNDRRAVLLDVPTDALVVVRRDVLLRLGVFAGDGGSSWTARLAARLRAAGGAVAVSTTAFASVTTAPTRVVGNRRGRPHASTRTASRR